MLDKKSTLNNIFCTIALFIASFGSAFASTQALVSEKQCDACHGANGVSGHTDIPTIAGIPEFNLSRPTRVGRYQSIRRHGNHRSFFNRRRN